MVAAIREPCFGQANGDFAIAAAVPNCSAARGRQSQDGRIGFLARGRLTREKAVSGLIVRQERGRQSFGHSATHAFALLDVEKAERVLRMTPAWRSILRGAHL